MCTGSTAWTTAEHRANSATSAMRLRKVGVNRANRMPAEMADPIDWGASRAVAARFGPMAMRATMIATYETALYANPASAP